MSVKYINLTDIVCFIMQLITHTKVMSLNRITVPKEVMGTLNLIEGDIAAFYEDKGNVVIKKGSIVPAED